MKIYRLDYYSSELYEASSTQSFYFETLEEAIEHAESNKRSFLKEYKRRDELVIDVNSITLGSQETEIVKIVYKSLSAAAIEQAKKALKTAQRYHPDADHSEMIRSIEEMKKHQHK